MTATVYFKAAKGARWDQQVTQKDARKFVERVSAEIEFLPLEWVPPPRDEKEDDDEEDEEGADE